MPMLLPFLFGAKAWAQAQMIPLVLAGVLALVMVVAGWAHHERALGAASEHQRQEEAMAETNRLVHRNNAATADRLARAEAKAAEQAESVVREILLPPLTVTVDHRLTVEKCPDYSPGQIAKINGIQIGVAK